MKKILTHIGIIIALTVVIVFATLWGLNIFTNHDAELISVPELKGDLSQSAIRKLKALELVGVVSDTVYKDGAKKLSIINQNPIPGSKVKPGRKVYLVINTNKVPMVAVPDMANKTSLNQAKNLLSKSHLKLGSVSNRVLDNIQGEPVLQQLDGSTGKVIAPGTLIERNSEIDLVVGISRDEVMQSDSTDSPMP